MPLELKKSSSLFSDPVSFDEGLVGKKSEAALYESGARLASRALARSVLLSTNLS